MSAGVTGGPSDDIEDTIKGIDNNSDKLVRPIDQSQYQSSKFPSKNGSEFVKNGSVFGKNGSEFGEFGAEFSKNGSVGTDRMQLFPLGWRLIF